MKNRLVLGCCLLVASLCSCYGFMNLALSGSTHSFRHLLIDPTTTASSTSIPTQSSPTALGVWFFGGSATEQTTADDESCELVAVRIERPSSNSRKIFGEITVPASLDDVWAILTDYDQLAVHVPNLVESKIVQRQPGGQQGDGTYRCRLFQRGAQKIVGFEFGASVTMDMKENSNDTPFALSDASGNTPHSNGGRNRERSIEFKCADSFFFKEFDGEWKATEKILPDGTSEVMLSYVVDVRPNGPVPVAALEWRIREDVPTNLRAVKKAAIEVGYEGVMASRMPKRLAPVSSAPSMASASSTSMPASRGAPNSRSLARNGVKSRSVSRNVGAVGRQPAASKLASARKVGNGAASPPLKRRLSRVNVQWETWEESETMAAYLDKKN